MPVTLRQNRTGVLAELPYGETSGSQKLLRCVSRREKRLLCVLPPSSNARSEMVTRVGSAWFFIRERGC